MTKRTVVIFWTLLFFVMTGGRAEITTPDAAAYFSLRPFGWGTCSDVHGTSYTLDGGSRAKSPKTVVLYSSGADDRDIILDAITNNDIVILDGSKGDFMVSKSMSLYGLQHKTIVGRNGARLCTEWYITPELKQVLVDANLGQYSSSSGTGGTLSNGKEVDEEREWKTRQTIIDYGGDATEAYRSSGFFQLNTTNENIIFRNLVFQGPGSVDVGGTDLISNNGGTHVWVDHCEFVDGMDGNLDSGHREGSSQYVTYSWNVFRYTERSYSHPYSNGVGWNKGYLQYITYAYNIWGEGCNRRLPQADWVYIHLANNYYDCAGNSVAIAVGANTHALVEGNYAADGVNSPFKPGGQSDLYYLARNNQGFGNYNDKTNTDISLEVPYEYPLIPIDSVPAVLRGTHGAGATIDDMIEDFLNLPWIEPEEPDVPETPSEPEEPDVPEIPEDVTYKAFTEDAVLLTTAENLSVLVSENWVRGGETSSSKGGTIDPTTGETVEKYSGGGILLKQGNSAKMLETYVTGVTELTAYACTAGSSDRTLVVTATSTDGEVVQGKGTSSGYVSTAVTIHLDGGKEYRISYTGVEAGNEGNGADMVLHGIKFVTTSNNIELLPWDAMVDIYDIRGVLIKRQVAVRELVETIPAGIYLINGRKVIVR